MSAVRIDVGSGTLTVQGGTLTVRGFYRLEDGQPLIRVTSVDMVDPNQAPVTADADPGNGQPGDGSRWTVMLNGVVATHRLGLTAVLRDAFTDEVAAEDTAFVATNPGPIVVQKRSRASGGRSGSNSKATRSKSKK
jgi:hypothetical protein